MANDLELSQRSSISDSGITIQDMSNIRRRMVEIVKGDIMVKDVHFGMIPGTNKDVLLKPGAEMLCMLFNLTAIPEIIESITDWTGADHGGEPLFYFHYRMSIYRGDTLICKSDGSANSHEKKYRWRWVQELEVPSNLDISRLQSKSSSITEFEWAIKQSQTSGRYGKPIEYWNDFKSAIDNGTAVHSIKKSQNGKEDDAWTINSKAYRIPNEDTAEIVNTLMKMAIKRCLVAAVLQATGASEFYTQDLDDMVDVIPLQSVPQPVASIESKGDIKKAIFEILKSVNPEQKARIIAIRDAILNNREFIDCTPEEAKIIRDAAITIAAEPQTVIVVEDKPVEPKADKASKTKADKATANDSIQGAQDKEIHDKLMAQIAMERKRVYDDLTAGSKGDTDYREWLKATHKIESVANIENSIAIKILEDLKAMPTFDPFGEN